MTKNELGKATVNIRLADLSCACRTMEKVGRIIYVDSFPKVLMQIQQCINVAAYTCVSDACLQVFQFPSTM